VLVGKGGEVAHTHAYTYIHTYAYLRMLDERKKLVNRLVNCNSLYIFFSVSVLNSSDDPKTPLATKVFSPFPLTRG
jgi:hypothetical protein